MRYADGSWRSDSLPDDLDKAVDEVRADDGKGSVDGVWKQWKLGYDLSGVSVLLLSLSHSVENVQNMLMSGCSTAQSFFHRSSPFVTQCSCWAGEQFTVLIRRIEKVSIE